MWGIVDGLLGGDSLKSLERVARWGSCWILCYHRVSEAGRGSLLSTPNFPASWHWLTPSFVGSHLNTCGFQVLVLDNPQWTDLVNQPRLWPMSLNHRHTSCHLPTAWKGPGNGTLRAGAALPPCFPPWGTKPLCWQWGPCGCGGWRVMYCRSIDRNFMNVDYQALSAFGEQFNTTG